MKKVEVFYKIFKDTEFEECVFSDNGVPWLRWDISDSDSKEQSDEYYILLDSLKEYGVVINDPQIEHDCISGDLALIHSDEIKREKINIFDDMISPEYCTRYFILGMN